MSTVPNIVTYQPSHFERVRELLLDAHVRPPDSSEEIEQGIGLVGFDPNWKPGDSEKPEIVAFGWALAPMGAKVAYLDYFGVGKGFRHTKAGYLLFLTLAHILRDRVGVEKLIASVSPVNRATLRMLERRGALVLGPQHYVVMGLGGSNGRHDTDTDATDATVASGGTGTAAP